MSSLCALGVLAEHHNVAHKVDSDFVPLTPAAFMSSLPPHELQVEVPNPSPLPRHCIRSHALMRCTAQVAAQDFDVALKGVVPSVSMEELHKYEGLRDKYMPNKKDEDARRV